MGTPKRRSKWRLFAILACGAVFVVSASLLARDMIRSHREQRANQLLAQQVREAKAAAGISYESERPEGAPRYANSGVLLQYDPLWQQNNDMAGWLCVEGTQLDYPVMYTPDDPEHYLRRAFDGSYAVSGSLFIGEGCTPDGSHVVIYGHHMKDGTMFGSLMNYADAEYGQEHPVIHYDTLTEEQTYRVLAAFYTKIYREVDDGVFRYYRYADLSQQEKFEEYVAQVQAISLYDTGVDAQFGDRLITLSTCSYHTDNGRFVVVAVQDPPAEAAPAPEEAEPGPEGEGA